MTWMQLARSGAAGARSSGPDAALKQCGRLADGWMTHSASPAALRDSWNRILSVAQESGRDTEQLYDGFYHHGCIKDDRERALHAAKALVDRCCAADSTELRQQSWLAYGSPYECIENLRTFLGSGARQVALRLANTDGKAEQFDRLANDVLPYGYEDALEITSSARKDSGTS